MGSASISSDSGQGLLGVNHSIASRKVPKPWSSSSLGQKLSSAGCAASVVPSVSDSVLRAMPSEGRASRVTVGVGGVDPSVCDRVVCSQLGQLHI